jgi:biotin carboxyl carrier protein
VEVSRASTILCCDADCKGDADETGSVHVIAPMTASVWKVLVEVGDRVEKGQTVAILEAMKMEIGKLFVYLCIRTDLRACDVGLS